MRLHADIAGRACRSATAAGLTVLLAGCGGLASLPMPAPGQTGDSMSLTAAFANALNLPAKAKVKLNGANIGEVESIRAKNFTAYVTMRINADVRLAAGTTAELRSATPLGDVFVAVRPDPNQAAGTPSLRNGDTIPENSTASGATIEEVLSSAALLVNGGAIRRLVSIVNGAGSAMGGRGAKVAELLQQSNALLSRLNARSAQINGALRSTSELAATVSARQDTLNRAIPAAASAIETVNDNVAELSDLVDQAARITRQLNRFPSLQGTDTRSLIADLNRVAGTLNDIVLDPNIDLNTLNRAFAMVTKLTSATNIHAVTDVRQLAFGALPDMNYPGDPGFHGADGTDWHALIASLRYEWNLLLSRVYGPEHRPRP